MEACFAVCCHELWSVGLCCGGRHSMCAEPGQFECFFLLHFFCCCCSFFFLMYLQNGIEEKKRGGITIPQSCPNTAVFMAGSVL